MSDSSEDSKQADPSSPSRRSRPMKVRDGGSKEPSGGMKVQKRDPSGGVRAQKMQTRERTPSGGVRKMQTRERTPSGGVRKMQTREGEPSGGVQPAKIGPTIHSRRTVSTEEPAPSGGFHARQTIAPQLPADEKTTVSDRAARAAAVVTEGEKLERKILKELDKHEKAPVIKRDPLIGRTIVNRFVVTSKIGAGGMGAVYKAKQIGMDRNVAIKILLKEFTENETAIKRFHLEALAVSKLMHPNTISIFDFGQTDDGILYIAMEFLDGISLQDMIRNSSEISVSQTLHIMRQTCRSLEEAHEKGIIHRDLKPDNIFACAIGGDPSFVKVLDFGVAKLRQADEKQGTLTQAGMIFGTPKYMSPEQSRSVQLDPRSDIYSLGIIMYEMLCGSVPFLADNPLGILIKHVQAAPAAFKQKRPDLIIPQEVEALVMKALQKSPDDRFQNAAAMAEAIENTQILVKGRTEFEIVLTKEILESIDIPEDRKATLTKEVVQLSASGMPIPGFEPTVAGGGDPSVGALTQSGLETVYVPIPKMPGRWIKRLSIATAALVLLLAGSTAIAYLNLPTLPERAMQVYPFEGELKQIRLAPWQSVEVTLKSTPEGADIYMNQRKIGKTPLTMKKLMLSPPIAVVLRMATYRELQTVVTFDKTQTITKQLELVLQAPPPVAEKPGAAAKKTSKVTAKKTAKKTPKKPRSQLDKRVPKLKNPYERRISPLKSPY